MRTHIPGVWKLLWVKAELFGTPQYRRRVNYEEEMVGDFAVLADTTACDLELHSLTGDRLII